MTRTRVWTALLGSLVITTFAHAQEGPPKGPADIIKRATQARQKPALTSDAKPGVPAQPAEAPPGHPTPGSATGAQPQAGQALPPGHPTPGSATGTAAQSVEALPPGHPTPGSATGSDGQAPPPGHPTPGSATGAQPKAAAQGASALPPGHPPTDAAGGEGELPPGHPPTDAAGGDGAQPPVGDDPHAHAEGAPALARRGISEAQPSADVPAGAIRVKVVDVHERPVANAELQLGTMSQDSGRTTTPAKTGADGSYVFTNLPGGDKLAYRVNVLHQGAKYSSTPFRLPPDRGYDVILRRLDTTRDAREVVLYVGATSVELKDERLRIVQQARLVNIGAKTYVFPEEGTLLRFPKEALAFQAEEVMTDQRMREVKGEGMRITGSLPPGEVTLTWGFDIPQTETTADLHFELPWVTFAYRVLADAAPGLTMEVEGMPAPELHEDRGRRLLVTEVVKRVGETPLREVRIKLAGIPGPGPLRFIAVGLALGVLGLGFVVSRKSVVAAPGGGSELLLQELQQEEARLLARAQELNAEHARGDIGPEFHKAQLSELEEHLSGILYEKQRLSQQSKAARPT